MKTAVAPGRPKGILGWIERVGNRVPDITILFIGAFLIVCVISALMSPIHFSYINPVTKEPIRIISMLAPSQLVKLMTKWSRITPASRHSAWSS